MGKETRRKPGIVIKNLNRRTNSIPVDVNERNLNSPVTEPATGAKPKRIIISSFSKKESLLRRVKLSADFNDEEEANSRRMNSQGQLPLINPTTSGSLHSFYMQTEPSKLVRAFSKQLHQIQNCSDLSFDEQDCFAESTRQEYNFTSRQNGQKPDIVSKPKSIQTSKTTSSGR